MHLAVQKFLLPVFGISLMGVPALRIFLTFFIKSIRKIRILLHNFIRQARIDGNDYFSDHSFIII